MSSDTFELDFCNFKENFVEINSIDYNVVAQGAAMYLKSVITHIKNSNFIDNKSQTGNYGGLISEEG